MFCVRCDEESKYSLSCLFSETFLILIQFIRSSISTELMICWSDCWQVKIISLVTSGHSRTLSHLSPDNCSHMTGMQFTNPNIIYHFRTTTAQAGTRAICSLKIFEQFKTIFSYFSFNFAEENFSKILIDKKIIFGSAMVVLVQKLQLWSEFGFVDWWIVTRFPEIEEGSLFSQISWNSGLLLSASGNCLFVFPVFLMHHSSTCVASPNQIGYIQLIFN